MPGEPAGMPGRETPGSAAAAQQPEQDLDRDVTLDHIAADRERMAALERRRYGRRALDRREILPLLDPDPETVLLEIPAILAAAPPRAS